MLNEEKWSPDEKEYSNKAFPRLPLHYIAQLGQTSQHEAMVQKPLGRAFQSTQIV